MRCATCNVKFESADLLAMHMLDHSCAGERKRSPGSPQASESWGSRSQDAETRDTETRTHEHKLPRQPYYTAWQLCCDYCKQLFGDRDSLAMHVISHTIKKEFSHRVSKSETYTCTQCGLLFIYRDLLVMHLLSNHRSQPLYPLDLSKDRRRPRSRDGHDGPERKQRRLAGSPCGDQTISLLALRDGSLQDELDQYERNGATQLVLARDVISWIAEDNKELYHCIHCDIIYKDKELYYLHNRLHNRNHPWQCNICGELCGSILEFSAHIIHN